MNIYGSVINGIHTDTSKTERGAKCYATRHGLDNISVRYNCGYDVDIVAFHHNGKWALGAGKWEQK